MRARRFARAAAVAWGALAVPLLAAAPALAERIDDGEAPSSSLGFWNVVLLFVVIPLSAFALIGLFTYLPSARRKPRYRPTRVWDYQAVWFNGPGKPEKAISTTTAIVMKGGGASAGW